MNKNIIFCLFVLLFIASGCAGKQGIVNVDQTVNSYAKVDYGIRKHGEIRFSVIGSDTYTGKPDSITYYGYSISVNLKAVQETAASKVLAAIYDNVLLSDSRATITSSISDFTYSWDFSFSAQPSVSFKISIFVTKNGVRSLYKEVNVKDFNGGEKRLLLGGIFGMLGSAINEEQDKRSQLVTNAVIKAVYGVYKKELPAIAKTL